MSTDPAVVAVVEIREAYSPVLAEKDAEIERLNRRNAELTASEQEMSRQLRIARASERLAWHEHKRVESERDALAAKVASAKQLLTRAIAYVPDGLDVFLREIGDFLREEPRHATKK